MNAHPALLVPLAASGEGTFLSLPFWAWQIVLAVAGIGVLTLLSRTIWEPTTRSLRWWGLGNIVVNAGIAVSGATVRVTSSGLGCPEWPRCTEDSFVPVGTDHATLNAAIEFGNRTLTFLVLAVGVIVFVASMRLRPRRPDLRRLAGIIPLGVLGQGVLGGVTVLTGLHPASVAAHFLLSSLVVVLTVAYYVRCREPRGRLQRTVPPVTRSIATVMVPLGFLLLAAGTVVTGTGPHGGDAEAPRWGFDPLIATRVHSGLAWAVLLGALALVLLLSRTEAPREARVASRLLAAAVLAQGALGYTQYALALPQGLVVLHVLGSALVWVAVLRVYFATARRTERSSGGGYRPPQEHGSGHRLRS
ncbi:cytochrome c oxidase assembly protein subunit 15 [Haloactinospora alba]|uniref:Cytochrome c oxidase assembly protein subunit 15 n=1 Tax=Haloactinospora alba TaxID=405555 RepID=A0A543NI08_9ACTN|nr:COX15/CtaA family protein [Haloactinospora alba]TQN31390.1 cytochrome c oxidase assembly protein subunit 15 [Haloactinospora alba]